MSEDWRRRRRSTCGAYWMVAAMTSGMLAFAVVSTATTQQGLAGPAEGESIAQWTGRWMEGPVGLIATKEEKEIYAELSTTQERLQFIRLFWEGRDPRIRGARNEFLDQFTERLALVQEKYSNSRQQGWETAFGQVVMLFGSPDRTRRELSGFPVDFSDRPPILWSYDKRIPELEPNENLLFVFRVGRWKLMPPYPIGPTAIPEAAREAERRSNVGAAIPSDYQRAMDKVIAESLVNAIDYRGAIDSVRTAVQLPDAQIPFGYSTHLAATGAGLVRVEIEMTWRMDTLVFHLIEGNFKTDMVVDAALLRDGEPLFVGSERVEVVVAEAEMEERRQEIVRRTLVLTAEPGAYDLELVLLDQLLGYRTIYRGALQVRLP